jgi:hypothetical protein
LIFYKTALEIRDNASSWIDQYIKNKLKWGVIYV